MDNGIGLSHGFKMFFNVASAIVRCIGPTKVTMECGAWYQQNTHEH